MNSDMTAAYSDPDASSDGHEPTRTKSASDDVKVAVEPSSAPDNSALQGAAVGTMRNASKYVKAVGKFAEKANEWAPYFDYAIYKARMTAEDIRKLFGKEPPKKRDQ